MKAPSPPAPPDPREVAGAQTANNVSTAIAQSRLNNVNQRTPYGSLDYAQTGTTKFTDPNTGDVYDIPSFTATQTLSPVQNRTLAQQAQAGLNMASLANDQSGALQDYLKTGIDTRRLPDGPDVDRLEESFGQREKLGRPRNYAEADVGDVGAIRTQFKNDDLTPQREIGSAGSIRSGLRDRTSDVWRGLDQESYQGSVAGGGRIQTGLGADTRGISGGPSSRNLREGFYDGPGPQTGMKAGTDWIDARLKSRANQVFGGVDNPGQRETFGSVGSVATGADNRAYELRRNVGKTNFQEDLNNDVAIGRSIGPAGALTRSYGTDFSTDRQRVEEALLSRMNPSLERDKEALRTQLINQGVREGSTAYDRAMNRFNEQSTDARMQAILAGGQEQSRMAGLEANRAAFENQAQGQAFGQARERAGFANQAQNQLFDQNLTRGQFRNDARDREFATNLQVADFANRATGQAFGQSMDAQEFRNRAQQQVYDQAQGRAAFRNTARMNEFGMGVTSRQLDNSAAGQRFAQEAQAQTQNNAAIGQRFGQGLQAGQFNNAAQAQAFGQAQAQTGFLNDAREREFAMGQSQAQLGNQAAAQRFGQNQQAMTTNNAAQAQQFGQNLAQGQFANDATARENASLLSQGQFRNAATGQEFQQQLATQNAYNAAQAQRFGQEQARGQFANDATRNLFDARMQQAGFNNQAVGQQFAQGVAQQNLSNQALGQNNQTALARASFNNGVSRDQFGDRATLEQMRLQDRNQALQEQFALRNQPINEIGALLGTGQVSQPNFISPQMGQIANVDRAGIEMDVYGQKMNAWQQQAANRSALMGGLLGAGGMLGAAWLGG